MVSGDRRVKQHRILDGTLGIGSLRRTLLALEKITAWRLFQCSI